MIPYSKSELNCCQNLPFETYNPIFFSNFNIKMFFQNKNVFASKTSKIFKIFSNLPSETYHTEFL